MLKSTKAKCFTPKSLEANRKSLSLIIPYRDRKEHLIALLPRLEDVLAIPYQITIVEQKDSALFNKGKLLNIGIIESFPSDYYCFHDVDFYPLNINYSYPKNPTRPFSFTTGTKTYSEKINLERLNRLFQEAIIGKERRSKVYSHFFGGVILINREDLFQIKGFSNRFECWGYEDLDFLERCFSAKRFPYFDSVGEYRLLPHQHSIYKERGIKDTILRNKAIYDKHSKSFDFDDGLSDIKYRVLEKKIFCGHQWISVTLL